MSPRSARMSSAIAYEVRAVVAVLGDLGLPSERLQVPRLDRRAEPVHLSARVVEVVLALHDPAGAPRSSRARASPSTAFRACPTWSGPVGLALTNSTCTRRPLAAARPYASPVATTSRSAVVQPLVGREDVQEARARRPPRAPRTEPEGARRRSPAPPRARACRRASPARGRRSWRSLRAPSAWGQAARVRGGHPRDRAPERRRRAPPRSTRPVGPRSRDLPLADAAPHEPHEELRVERFRQVRDGPEGRVLRLVVVADARAEEDDGHLGEAG